MPLMGRDDSPCAQADHLAALAHASAAAAEAAPVQAALLGEVEEAMRSTRQATASCISSTSQASDWLC